MNLRRAVWKPGIKRGFTLIEILVVILVITILIALLIPAVQAARSSARRAACDNNMRQIGIALSNYSTSFTVYPSGSSGETSFSFYTSLLPFIDNVNMYNSLNFSIDITMSGGKGGQNSTVAFAVPPVLLCPSDTYEDNLQVFGRLKQTNYPGNGGFGFTDEITQNGTFGTSPPIEVNHASISDGLSNTVLVTEWSLGKWSPISRDPLVATFTTEPLTLPGDFDKFSDACKMVDTSNAIISSGRLGFWTRGKYGQTLMNFVLQPNDVSCSNGGTVGLGALTAGSYHGPGVNALYADGHVAFVKEKISLALWRALSTRAGGEVVQDQF